MSLHINSTIPALSAYQHLGTRPASAAAAPSSPSTGSDVVSFTTTGRADIAAANIAAAGSTISDADLAAQLVQLAAAQITADSSAALAAQAGVSAEAALSLLQ